MKRKKRRGPYQIAYIGGDLDCQVHPRRDNPPAFLMHYARLPDGRYCVERYVIAEVVGRMLFYRKL